jgi:4'-phosphopantetheinyl transferase
MMPALHLTNVQITQLDHETWCVTAQVNDSSSSLSTKDLWDKSVWLSSSNSSYIDFTNLSNFDWYYPVLQKSISKRSIAHSKRQQQRLGVRHLLQKLLNKLEINDTLDESSFPYRLTNSKYYVCFSHTGTHDKNNINKNLSQNTAKISYSKIAVVISRHRPAGIDIEHNNVAWHVAQRFYAANEIAILQELSTMDRDSITKLLWQIKESFIKVHQYTLAQGLGVDYSNLIPNLIHNAKENAPYFRQTGDDSDYRMIILPSQQTVVIF